MITGKQLYVVAVQTVVVDVVECPYPVLLSHYEVIDTVIRGGMYTASARLSGDMITAQHGHVTMVKGVAQLQLLQRFTATATNNFMLIDAHPLQHGRSEEHTSELQSRGHLVCRLLLDKKNKKRY